MEKVLEETPIVDKDVEHHSIKEEKVISKPVVKIEKNKELKKETPIIKEETKKEDLSLKTLTELKTIAKEKGIKGYSTMKKQEIIDAINV